ncbi:LAFE_0D12596g1_1 [Lachancea fermentati]|uniref:Peroxisome assembly protein 22 n=1 Tax=Lachancea fermentati TaxID=4955 RepID=A0A1G4MCC8_LACFM|nr:LAFE_0D12596g1_1 [Lachancea fermentati]
MTRKTKNRVVGRVLVTGILVAAAVGLFVIARLKDKPSKEKKSEKKDPKTIIVTNTVYRAVDNWESILQDDVVLLIPPNCGFKDDLQSLDRDNSHKIIGCDTMEGLWSVTRHLRKKELVLLPGELDGIPDDLARYCERIVRLGADNIAI